MFQKVKDRPIELRTSETLATSDDNRAKQMSVARDVIPIYQLVSPTDYS
jgi:hypothetical protein